MIIENKNNEKVSSDIKKIRKNFQFEHNDLEDTSSLLITDWVKVFKSIANDKLFEELWFINNDFSFNVFSKLAKKMEDILLHIEENPSEFKNISNQNDEIDFDLFAERVKKMTSILNYVEENFIPSEEYELLSWKEKILSFAILTDNWDGEEAKKTQKSKITASIKFLKDHEINTPDLKMVYPSWDGSVGLVYEFNEYNINILFKSKDKIDVSLLNTKLDDFKEMQYNIEEIKSIEQFII